MVPARFCTCSLFVVSVSILDAGKLVNIPAFFDSAAYTWGMLPLLVFLARITDVSLDKLRIIFINRNLRYYAAILAPESYHVENSLSGWQRLSGLVAERSQALHI
jgi:hypothetical protein